MALRINQRVQRVVKLLRGVSHPEVARVLARYGFTAADVNKGWGLLMATAPFTLHSERAPASPEILGPLDAFENQWFPIVRLALDANYPEISERFFTDLGQTSGAMVIASVTIFVERLEGLEKGVEPFGPDGPAARELLTVRGLTPERVAEAKALLEQVRHFEEPVTVPDDKSGIEAAEQALWTWYLEWSGVIRHSIADRRWLQRLGLGGRKARRSESPEEPEPTDRPEALAFGMLPAPLALPAK